MRIALTETTARKNPARIFRVELTHDELERYGGAHKTKFAFDPATLRITLTADPTGNAGSGHATNTSGIARVYSWERANNSADQWSLFGVPSFSVCEAEDVAASKGRITAIMPRSRPRYDPVDYTSRDRPFGISPKTAAAPDAPAPALAPDSAPFLAEAAQRVAALNDLLRQSEYLVASADAGGLVELSVRTDRTGGAA